MILIACMFNWKNGFQRLHQKKGYCSTTLKARTYAFSPAHTRTRMHTHTPSVQLSALSSSSPLLWSTETIGKSEGEREREGGEREREGGGDRERETEREALTSSLTHSLTHPLPPFPTSQPHSLPPSLSLCRNPSHHHLQFDFC